MRKLLPVLIISLTVCSSSEMSFADYTGFLDWQKLTADQKAKYAAGVFDSYLTFSMIRPKAAYHFSSCAFKNKITDAQLASGTEDYAVAHPEVKTYPVAAIVLNYLVQICGAPPMEK